MVTAFATVNAPSIKPRLVKVFVLMRVSLPLISASLVLSTLAALTSALLPTRNWLLFLKSPSVLKSKLPPTWKALFNVKLSCKRTVKSPLVLILPSLAKVFAFNSIDLPASISPCLLSMV